MFKNRHAGEMGSGLSGHPRAPKRRKVCSRPKPLQLTGLLKSPSWTEPLKFEINIRLPSSSMAFERRCSENFSVSIVSVFNGDRDRGESPELAADCPEARDKIS